MAFENIDLSAFPSERERSLKEIYRYGKFKTMFYRSNLWDHSKRVLWIVEDLLPIASKYLNIDPNKARTLALVHDDPEIITGDMPGDHKTKMSAAEALEHDKKEEAAIKELSQKYLQEINGYSYEDLLLHALKKDCPEAWLVSYADKLDAYGESMHDLLAGNYILLWSVMFYVRTFMNFEKKFPELAPMLAGTESLLINPKSQVPPYEFHPDTYLLFGKPHTSESIKSDTDFPLYNTWKKIVLGRGGESSLEYLTKQKEFLS